MIENQIIKAFMLDKKLWDSFYRFVSLEYVRTNYPTVYKLFVSLNSYYEKYAEVSSCSALSLESQYLVLYPVLREADRKELSLVVANIESAPVQIAVIGELLATHRSRSITSQIALTALDVSENRKPLSDLKKLTDLLDVPLSLEQTDEFITLTTDIEELASQEHLEPGLRWRLTGLNKSLGPLRKGNMGHIFGRIESGKSACWISEATFMLPQLKADQQLAIFFNEEDGKAIIWRMYSAVLHMEYPQILANPKEAKRRFYEAIGGENKILFFDRPSLSKKFIEKALDQCNAGLIVIDNMDKVTGFDADRKDLQLAQCYKWGRELAKTYAPVLTVGQADMTADNRMWISESQMADGKTGKPSETDFTIGIGRTDTSQHPNERYIYISRNKLRGDKHTLEGLRHAKFSTILEPTYSTYTDGGTYAIK